MNTKGKAEPRKLSKGLGRYRGRAGSLGSKAGHLIHLSGGLGDGH